MHISYMAMNRMLEERALEDEAYRQQLRRSRRCTLSDARSLSDEALLEKLRSLGLTEASRDWLDRFSRKAPSAQILATALTRHGGLDVPVDQEDWIWFALVCLWERWFPDRPNCEMLDDWMQAGYQAEKRDERLAAARLWLQVWRGIEHLMATFLIESIEEFDEWFGGTNSVCNWVQEFSDALRSATFADPSFPRERLAVCKRVLALAGKSQRDSSLIPHFRRDLAESHADLDEYETADSLYAKWLRDDPQWGWGWIGWSDIYHTFAREGRGDASKAEQILTQGLAVAEVRDREDLCQRLVNLYEETGRPAAAAAAVAARHAQALDDEDRNPQRRGEATSEDSQSGSDLDAIIAELEAEYTGELPEQAIREAQRRREEFTPRLIDVIRKATECVRSGDRPQGDAHLFALYLLAEFEAKHALPTILEAVSLPDRGAFALFGDAITEDLCRVLAVLAADTPEVIDEMIVNPSLNEYVRWEAAQTYLLWVRDGRMTRDEAVDRLRRYLRDAIANKDAELAEGLVSELLSYSPQEALDEIREAFRLQLVDPLMVDMADVERSIRGGESRFQEELKSCRPTGVQDTVEELSCWAAFQKEEPFRRSRRPAPPFWTTLSDDWDLPLEAAESREVATTIRNTSPKVGRNDPCPCGSGKKYKKCCGNK